ncbi:hypothetical protein AWV80_13490 [Cupriavidus sp. UYMU48A]|nr:hypothetical protein AWV80_13490 [Cupriavidus sp. UYMU48A]
MSPSAGKRTRRGWPVRLPSGESGSAAVPPCSHLPAFSVDRTTFCRNGFALGGNAHALGFHRRHFARQRLRFRFAELEGLLRFALAGAEDLPLDVAVRPDRALPGQPGIDVFGLALRSLPEHAPQAMLIGHRHVKHHLVVGEQQPGVVVAVRCRAQLMHRPGIQLLLEFSP